MTLAHSRVEQLAENEASPAQSEPDGQTRAGESLLSPLQAPSQEEEQMGARDRWPGTMRL